MKPTREEKLAIYRRVLRKYEAEGDPKADIQRRLIARLEQEKGK